MKNKHSIKRPSWDHYFMQIAKVVASRSNCLTRQTGAVIVRDRMILSTGYNGTPRHIKNCNEGGCPRCNNAKDSQSDYKTGTKLDNCFCVHAEENAIIQAAYHGMNIQEATLYAFYSPCIFCAKSIINGGITRIVYNKAYSMDENAKRLIKEADIELVKLEPEV